MAEELSMILNYSKSLFVSYVEWVKNTDTSPKTYIIAATAVTAVALAAWSFKKYNKPSTSSLDLTDLPGSGFTYDFKNTQVIKIKVPRMSEENFKRLELHCKLTAINCLQSRSIFISSDTPNEITIIRELHSDESVIKMDDDIRAYLATLLKSECSKDSVDEQESSGITSPEVRVTATSDLPRASADEESENLEILNTTAMQRNSAIQAGVVFENQGTNNEANYCQPSTSHNLQQTCISPIAVDEKEKKYSPGNGTEPFQTD